MKSVVLLIAILIVLSSAQQVQYLWAYDNRDFLGRHTPGFPYNITSEYILKILESIYRNLGNISSQSVKIGKEDVVENLYNISKQLRDEGLRNKLMDIANSYSVNGSIDRETLIKAVELAENSNASLSDINQFLNALKSVAQAEGYQDIISLTENTLAKLIEKLVNSTRFQQEKGFVSQVQQELMEVLPKFSQALEPMPSLDIAFPQISTPGTQIPSPLLSIELTVLITGIVLVVIIALLREDIVNAFKKVVTRRRVVGVREWYQKAFAQGVRKAIANYWRAVEFIEKVYMVRKEDWMTHREYLAVTSSKLKDLRTFEIITQLYEAARYAHDPRSEVDEESENYLRTLIGEKE